MPQLVSPVPEGAAAIVQEHERGSGPGVEDIPRLAANLDFLFTGVHFAICLSRSGHATCGGNGEAPLHQDILDHLRSFNTAESRVESLEFKGKSLVLDA